MAEITASEAGERPTGESDLHARAACLINPHSGIANDFLNHFNEILLLVENLPLLLPEMVDELLTWGPLTYVEYFQKSKLPGSPVALGRYEAMDAEARSYFDFRVDRLNRMAVDIVAKISVHREPDGSIPPERVADYCLVAGESFRNELDQLATFVNSGYEAALAGSSLAAAV